MTTRQGSKVTSDTSRRLAAKETPVAETPVSRVCKGLCYQTEADRTNWAPLPNWSQFLMQAGAIICSIENTEKRTVASFSLPTRAYAAAFLSTGAVLSRLSSSLDAATDIAHIQQLCALPRGTPVTLCRNNRILKGLFMGCGEFEGKVLARVQVENARSGALEYQIAQEQWARIQVSALAPTALPSRQKGRLNDPGNMLTAIIGPPKALDHTLTSQLDCVVVGRANIMLYEIGHTQFCYKVSDSCCSPGNLQEILRVRRFLGNSNAYRSDVISIDDASFWASQNVRPPTLMVFDGARAYLKCHHLWPNSHAAVILDRTDLHFDEAAQLINQDFVQRRIGSAWPQQKLPPIPIGIEVMVYEEARR